MNKNKTTLKVTELAQQARSLAANIRNCDDAIEQGAAWFFNTPVLMAQVLSHQHAFATRLVELADAAVETEHARTQEAADDDAPRQTRDEAYEALYSAVSEGRGYLEHVVGVGTAAQYGLTGDIRRRSDELSALTHNTIALMEANPLQSSNRFGGGVNTVLIVAELKPLLHTLDAALLEVAKESVEYRDALKLRNDALIQLSTATTSALAAHTAMLTIAKRHDLIRAARAIRKSFRNPTPKQAPEVVEPTPETPTPHTEA